MSPIFYMGWYVIIGHFYYCHHSCYYIIFYSIISLLSFLLCYFSHYHWYHCRHSYHYIIVNTFNNITCCWYCHCHHYIQLLLSPSPTPTPPRGCHYHHCSLPPSLLSIIATSYHITTISYQQDHQTIWTFNMTINLVLKLLIWTINPLDFRM